MCAKAHNTAQMRRSSKPLHHKHKTSNVSLVHTIRRINEAFFNKMRVHNFPFGVIKISSKKRITTQQGRCKSAFSVNLHPLRLPVQSTNILGLRRWNPHDVTARKRDRRVDELSARDPRSPRGASTIKACELEASAIKAT
jgi:hypothetical protein